MNITAAYHVWKEEFGGSYDQEGLKKHTKDFLKKYYDENSVPVKYGLYVLLDYLRDAGWKMAAASSSPRWEVEKHFKNAGVSDYFAVIVCGDIIEHSKPAPDIYLKTCEKLEAVPKDCYALEDSKNGLLAAYRAGCRPIMVPDLWQPDEETLQIITAKYDDLEQVKSAFEKGEL